MNLAGVLENKASKYVKIAVGSGVNIITLIAGKINSRKDNGLVVENVNVQELNNIDEKITEQVNENKLQNEDYKIEKIDLGSIVVPKENSNIYKSADSNISDIILENTYNLVGINKIACIIDGIIYSTKNYSVDQIYEMAEKENASIRYHLDKAIIMNDKPYVQVKGFEKGKNILSYVYFENGLTKYMNGQEFVGDIEGGIGWIDSNNCTKIENNEK